MPVENRDEVKRTNEIKTAIPLLEGIDIAGKDITADALLTQRKLAEYLVEKRQAHYYFTVKGNQPGLLEDLEFYFRDRGQPHFIEQTPPDHGRSETRQICRIGANVGRQGFLWSGEAYVGRKSEWPVWTPPPEMIKRQPEAAKYAHGMAPGLDNPLGARTLHLYQNGVYTLYTIYSTSDPETIGTNLTSGCTGLLTQDMIDLYGRTPVKTKVVVLPA